MGFFDAIGDAAKAVGNAVADAAGAVVDGVGAAVDWVSDRVSDVGGWFGDLFSGNLGTQAVPAPELVDKIMKSRGAPDWHGGAQTAGGLARDHSEIGGRIQEVTAGLESVWTGAGADAARAKMKPLADVAEAAARTFTANSQNLTGLAHGFDDMKRSMTPMPDRPPHKSFGDVIAPWETDTEKKIREYNQTAQQNLQRYDSYARQARSGGSDLKIDYGQLQDYDGGDVTLAQKAAPPPGKPFTPYHGREPFPPEPKVEAPPPPVLPPPGPRPPLPRKPAPGKPQPGQPQPGQPPVYTRPDRPPVHTMPLQHTPSDERDHTRAAGYTPPGGSGYSPTAFGSAGGGGATPGEFGPGTGQFGGGAANQTGTGTGNGNGRGSGAATSGNPRGGANGGLPGEGRGTPGGRGAQGMGGAGMGGGKGGEDGEHSRKYGVEDDSVFAIDENGDREVDPRTGLPIVPPTIGG
ncbi:hypothetical protein [Amycolatopsis samaneae]|uniref:PPE family protein n=1 Tax=Amycolatopsis samaneae TaxID=664691 RepID=A0ABW5GL74_9PSEU